MKMRYLLFLFTILLLQCGGNKIITRQNIDRSDILYWSEGRKLTWDDFQGNPILTDSSVATEIYVSNPSSFRRANVFSKTELSAECFMDKKKSWVNKKYATSQLLLYNQTIFDLYELFTRKLRQTFESTKFGHHNAAIDQFNELVEKNNEELRNRIYEFRTDSKASQDVGKVTAWSVRIKEELKSLDNYRTQ